MKILSLLPVAAFSLSLCAPTGHAAAQSPMSASGAVQTSQMSASGANVSAELTKRIDAKKAKVGDEVEAKTTSATKLPNGTDLPKGTKLVGKITDVRVKSGADKTSHLAFNIDHAVTKSGQEMPVRASVTSVTGHAEPAPEMSASAPGGGGGSPGGGSGGAGGASAGGAGGGSAPSSSGVTAPSSMGSMGSQPATAEAAVARGPNDRVPVANMPGVVLTSADGASSAGSLDATNQNIALDSGTKMTLNVSAGAQ
jgi:hypothetical protein